MCVVFCPRDVIADREYPSTLLSLFVGIFCLQPHRSSHVYAVVMANVFAARFGRDLHTVYDIKGSSFKRQVLTAEELVRVMCVTHNDATLPM